MNGRPSSSWGAGRKLALAVQAVVSLGLVGWLVTRFDLGHAFRIVAAARRDYLLVGFLAAIGVLLLLATRFAAVLRKGGLQLPAGEIVALTWIGQFWNFFLPGSTGGDLYRMGTLWRAYPERRTDALIAVFVDRLIATALLALFAGVGLVVLPLGPAVARLVARPAVNWSLIGGIAAALCVVAVLALVWAGPRLRRLLGTVRDRLRDGRVFLRPDAALLRIVAWGVAGHLANFLVFFCYARALGLNLSYFQVCLFLPLVLLLLILPLSVNGHGVREMLLVLFLGALGVVPPAGAALAESVLALSVVGLSSDLVLGVAGGIVFSYRRLRDARNGTNGSALSSASSPP